MAGEKDRTAVIQEARICLLAGARIKDSADPSDALIVLLSGPLSELHGTLFIPADLARLVKEHFGWELSAEAIEFFIPKMRTLGWLDSRSELPARGPFYVNLPEPKVGEEGGPDTAELLTELGKQFLAFAKELSPFQTLPESPLEAGATLLRYVVDANLLAHQSNEKARSDADFLAARFVEEANRQNLPVQETLASLSAVGFLFRVAEEIARPSRSRKVDLRIVVDGPILLDFLGCSGPIRAAASKEVFERVRLIGAQTVTFEHCVREAQDALRSVLRAEPRNRYGPTGDALRKGLVIEKALLQLAQAFDVAVRNQDIAILPDDLEFTPQAHKFFDAEKARELEAIVNWHEDNDQARYADSDTTVLTIRRRGGHRTTDLFDSKFVTVTTNPVFAGATKRHLQEVAYYNSRQVPPIIALKELAAKLWLEVGNTDKGAILSMPNGQLLMSCDRALRLNRKVVEKARSELEKVRPEHLQQFELLLEIPRSARAVMDVALNNERYVTGDTVDELLAAAVEAAGEEVAAKARAQRKRDLERHQKEIAAAEVKLQVEREKLRESQIAVAAANARRSAADDSILEASAEDASTLFQRLRGWVRAASLLIAVLPIVTIGAAWWRAEVAPIWFVIGLAAAVLGAAAAMDRPGAWLSRVIQARLDNRVEARLRQIGRYDLAESLRIQWADGQAIVSTTLAGH
jgi:hypothetical protein